MADTLTIRRAERGDEVALLGLWTQFLDEQSRLDGRFRIAEDAAERWRNDFPAAAKHDRRRIFVAERAGEMAGFITALRWAPPPIYELTSEVFVEEIYVRSDARDAHVGAGLLDAVKSWAGEIGANRLRLGALAENAEGRAFWEKQGANPFSITYTIELGSRKDGDDKPKAKLGF